MENNRSSLSRGAFGESISPSSSYPRVVVPARCGSVTFPNIGAILVYVDFLQNLRGKTVAGVYAVRVGVQPQPQPARRRRKAGTHA